MNLRSSYAGVGRAPIQYKNFLLRRGRETEPHMGGKWSHGDRSRGWSGADINQGMRDTTRNLRVKGEVSLEGTEEALDF